MNNISHNGHRERIRAQYIANGIDNMPDHNVLELLLSISIPRKDVKPIAYECFLLGKRTAGKVLKRVKPLRRGLGC